MDNIGPMDAQCARCSLRIDPADLLNSGWVIVGGRLLCPEDADRIRLSVTFDALNADILDGISQAEPSEPEGIALPDPDPCQTMDADVEDP